MLPYLHKKMTLGENSVHKLIRASGAMEKNRRKTTISSKFGLGCFSYGLYILLQCLIALVKTEVDFSLRFAAKTCQCK